MCTQHGSTTIYKANANKSKGEIDSKTILVRDFDTSSTPMDRLSRQKINKETQALNVTLDSL